MSIKKGDLVMVVKPTPCCGDSTWVGRIETVLSVGDGLAVCKCGFEENLTVAIVSNDESGHLVSCLKKIDPPSTGELDRVPVRMKEPA